ncbi:hypothetical protein Y032_0273g989 [Ancylostoma ceylanicum]|uniref:Peptidase M12A domain-containing protein n=1 Tax=Ancylostoma ceylanicum TaxID=53326 RepID=A0A016S8J4_9BILA|nr:hypothetical protein Y032_0273g989 [Ancylostoma ceylanicum]
MKRLCSGNPRGRCREAIRRGHPSHTVITVLYPPLLLLIAACIQRTSREQEADFTNAVRGEASIEPRQKRHAYRGKDYPTNTWGEKVYYQFDIHASQTLKDEFKRAAMAWQQDTCIDFEEETREHNRSIFKWGIHYEPNGGSRFTYRHPIVGLRLPAKLCRDPSPKYM